VSAISWRTSTYDARHSTALVPMAPGRWRLRVWSASWIPHIQYDGIQKKTNHRQPVDLQETTRSIKARVSHVIGQQAGLIFADPKSVMLELVLAAHEIEAAIAEVRNARWPRP
jgi:hypothetical protein